MELRRAARMGHEVVLLQILSRDEIEPSPAIPEFTDLEREAGCAGDQRQAGAARNFSAAMAAFLE